MKIKHLILFASLATSLALPSQALEQRTFHNADKSKSFQGTLAGYNAKTKTVTVTMASGAQKSFRMNVLSEESQKYVIANQDRLAIGNSVRLRFKEVKNKGGGEGVATSYAIEVRNSGEKAIADVTLRYTLYYRQGDLQKGGTIAKTSKGTLSTGKIYDADTLTVSTQSVDIVRKSKPASGGGWCGPNVPGGRRVDNMIGVVVDIVVDGEVVKTDSSSRSLLGKVMKDRS